MSITTDTGVVLTSPSSTSSTSSSTTIGLIPFQPTTSQTTPTTTPTSLLSISSSSSSAAGSSSSSTSSSSSISSSTSTIISKPPSTTAASTTSQIFTPATSDGLPPVVTEVSTTVVQGTTTPSAAAAVNNHAATAGFFSNKAAVAGVFTIVGLIGVVILVFLLVNAIRRHRAKQFDNELFAATREAAAISANPNLLDDDDDDEAKDRLKHNGFGPAYGGGVGNGYGGAYSSDGSHGPYGPPLEAFGMRDMVTHNSVPVGEIYDPYAAGGAAGIGVARARSAKTNMTNSSPNIYAAALQSGGSPYPKFAIPPPKQEGGAGTPPLGRGNSTNAEFGGAYRQQYPSLGRTNSDPTGDPPVSSLTRAPTYAEPPQKSLPNPHHAFPSQPSGSTGDDAAYGGYIDEAFEEEEEEAPKRVLKVANES